MSTIDFNELGRTRGYKTMFMIFIEMLRFLISATNLQFLGLSDHLEKLKISWIAFLYKAMPKASFDRLIFPTLEMESTNGIAEEV